jgi:hypothetical protein
MALSVRPPCDQIQRMARRFCILACAAFAFARLGAQTSKAPPFVPPPASAGASASARAVRTTKRPVIDGRMDDDVWRSAPATRGFRQFYPREDGLPSVETEFRVAFDDRHLYVLVRGFDPHPDMPSRDAT